MSYILDTQTLIWALLDTSKIPATTREIIQDTKNEILVSVVSYWECSIKYSIGKIEMLGFKPDDLPVLSEKSQISTLPLNVQEAASGYKLPWMRNHKDSFDRLIIWQAIQNRIPMISSDSEFELYRQHGLQLIW